jgi:hypothetical protein
MNAFATIRPESLPEGGTSYVVTVFHEDDTWVGICDDIPVATEASTIDQLIERVWLIAPEIADLNGLPSRDLRLRFVLDTQPALT